MSETQSQSAAEINAQNEASRANRNHQAATPVKTAPKAAPKKAAPKTVKPPTPRKALTPKERAAKPVTATIASYVDWLDKTVYAGKLSKAQRDAAGVSITLYGAYQTSPERRAARTAK